MLGSFGKKESQYENAPVSVTALRRKVSWHSKPKEYQEVTLHNKPHRRDLLGTSQEGGHLCSAEKSLDPKQKPEQALYRCFLRASDFPGWPRSGGKIL